MEAKDTKMSDMSTKLCVEPINFESNYYNNPDENLSQQSGPTVRTLAASLDQKCSFKAIKRYMQSCDESTLRREMLKRIKDRLIITHVIERNDAELLRLFLEFDEQGSCALDFGDVPVLAFAIMRSKWSNQNTTDIVRTLLAFGADPNVIPKELWNDYIYTPALVTLTTSFESTELTAWCTVKKRRLLSQTLNLTMRYSLKRASRMEPVKKRTLQIAKANRIQPLLRIPYVIIGQEIATRLVIDQIFGHIAMQKQQPLVLAFAGLSGHGKTELASTLGQLLSADFIEIDCSQTSTVFSLLGPTAGYHNHKLGSPLNNFLAESANRRNVVFLDEYDKTVPEVREALLKPMDNAGIYRERRGNTDVDCSKVIWILATNKGDTAISKFYSKHFANRKDEEFDQVSIEPLRRQLNKLFTTLYSPAVAGRINSVIPFFPFSEGEQAAIIHKFYLRLHDKVRKDVDIKEPFLRLVGHCLLMMNDDGKICQHLAKGYVEELGARSLETKVDEISQAFLEVYMKRDELVDEKMNMEPLQKFVVQLNRVEEGVEEISVFEDRKSEHEDAAVHARLIK